MKTFNDYEFKLSTDSEIDNELSIEESENE